ncbi:MAG: YidB family protein [Steroidobacteraceae bacterium]
MLGPNVIFADDRLGRLLSTSFQPLTPTLEEITTMGLLDGVLGGAVGAEMATVVNGFITSHGGVQGIVAQMEQQGLGSTVKSWVGTGTNAPITPDQVHAAFGPEVISNLAAKFGLNPQDLAQKLSQALPQAIDHLTPNGAVKPG